MLLLRWSIVLHGTYSPPHCNKSTNPTLFNYRCALGDLRLQGIDDNKKCPQHDQPQT